MKVSRAQAEENRNKILEVAGELFRQRGFDRVGIADLMKGAGLTHGGFYGNFKSKEDLVDQASERVLLASADRWESIIEKSGSDPFADIVRTYVSQRHRDMPDKGCALTALAPEAARQGGAVRAVFGAGVQTYLALLSRLLPGATTEARRRKALSALSEMVGAIILARITADEGLSDEILEATSSHLIGGPRETPFSGLP